MPNTGCQKKEPPQSHTTPDQPRTHSLDSPLAFSLSPSRSAALRRQAVPPPYESFALRNQAVPPPYEAAYPAFPAVTRAAANGFARLAALADAADGTGRGVGAAAGVG